MKTRAASQVLCQHIVLWMLFIYLFFPPVPTTINKVVGAIQARRRRLIQWQQDTSAPSAPAAIRTTSGFTESLESLTRVDRQTHKTHTRNRGGPARAGFIKGGVDCGDGWEATSSGLNGCVPQRVPPRQPTRECTWTGTRCDLSPPFFPPFLLFLFLFWQKREGPG